jgi:hypothetical protein
MRAMVRSSEWKGHFGPTILQLGPKTVKLDFGV